MLETSISICMILELKIWGCEREGWTRIEKAELVSLKDNFRKLILNFYFQYLFLKKSMLNYGFHDGFWSTVFKKLQLFKKCHRIFLWQWFCYKPSLKLIFVVVFDTNLNINENRVNRYQALVFFFIYYY